MSKDDGENKSKRTAINVGFFPSFKRILVAYDGMEMSKRALSYASYFSTKSDSEIVLLNVIKANRDLDNITLHKCSFRRRTRRRTTIIYCRKSATSPAK